MLNSVNCSSITQVLERISVPAFLHRLRQELVNLFKFLISSLLTHQYD